MAAKKDKAEGTDLMKEGEAELAACLMPDFDLNPEEFDTIGRPDIDGWFSAEPGYGFYGELIASFTFQDKRGNERDAVCIRTKMPTRAVLKGESKDPFVMPAGKVLAVGISYSLQEVLDYVEHKGVVWAKCTARKELDNDQTVLKYDLRVKGKKSVPVTAQPLAPGQMADGPPPGF